MPEDVKKRPGLTRKALAEFIATFFVTLTATSVDILYYAGGHVDYVSRWLTRGFIAAAMIYAFSEISGAHANPAVTITFLLRRVLSFQIAVTYVIVQMIGALAAGLLVPGYGDRSSRLAPVTRAAATPTPSL